jgi:hypothetical protein
MRKTAWRRYRTVFWLSGENCLVAASAGEDGVEGVAAWRMASLACISGQWRRMAARRNLAVGGKSSRKSIETSDRKAWQHRFGASANNRQNISAGRGLER